MHLKSQKKPLGYPIDFTVPSFGAEPDISGTAKKIDVADEFIIKNGSLELLIKRHNGIIQLKILYIILNLKRLRYQWPFKFKINRVKTLI